MLFSNRFSKFGKGTNLNAIMPSRDLISIYYFLDAIEKKNVKMEGETLRLERENLSLGYSEVVPLGENNFVTRIDKSLGIMTDEN